MVEANGDAPLIYDKTPSFDPSTTNVTSLLYTQMCGLGIVGFLGIVFLILMVTTKNDVFNGLLGFSVIIFIFWTVIVVPIVLLVNKEAVGVCSGADTVNDIKYIPYSEASKVWTLIVHSALSHITFWPGIARVIYVCNFM